MVLGHSHVALWYYLAAVVLIAAASQAVGQTITISSTSGTRGSQVEFVVSLNTGGASVAGTENQVAFNRTNTPIAAKADGTPNCTVNAAIGKGDSFSIFLPRGCSGSSCLRVRTVILSLSNQDPIPNGAWLYKCKVNISSSAPLGNYPLTISGVIASNAAGDALPGATGVSGQVTVR